MKNDQLTCCAFILVPVNSLQLTHRSVLFSKKNTRKTQLYVLIQEEFENNLMAKNQLFVS